MVSILNRWRLAVAIACVIIILLIAAVTVQMLQRFNSNISTTNTTSSLTDVCISQECISASVLLMKNMDFRADPCQDFFQFSCGGYVKETVFRPETIHSGDSKFKEIEKELQHIIFELLSLPSDSASTNSSSDSAQLNQAVEQLPQTFFKSCLEYKSTKANQISALQQVLWKDIQDAVNPMVSLEIGSGTSLAKNLTTSLMVADTLIGGNMIMSTEIEGETFIKGILNENNLVIQSGDSMFLFDGLKNISEVKEFFTAILNPKYKLYNRNVTYDIESHWPKMTQRLAALHEEFTSIKSQFCTDEFDGKILKLTYNQLINYQLFAKDENDTLRYLGDALDWPMYFQKIFLNTNISLEKQIIFKNPLCLTKMLMALQKSLLSSIERNEKPPVSIVLLNINVLTHLSNILPTEVQALINRSELFNISNALEVFDVASISSFNLKNYDWQECVSATIKNLEPLTVWLYAKKYFKFGRAPVLKLSEEIKLAFKTNVRRAQWLSALSKQLIISKVDDIRQSTAYPNFTVEDFHKLYLPMLQGLGQKADGLRERFGVLFALSLKSKTRISLDLLFNNEISLFTEESPLQTNAFNFQKENTIVFPVGILRPPIFHPEYPDYVNYALAGYIIGHEIGHSFDEIGHKYSMAYKNSHLWDNKTEEEYLKRQNCFKDAYNKYELDSGVQLDGNSTVGNNMADALGISSAFTAWQLAGYPGVRFPGRLSKYSTNQLFFLFSAQIWCERRTTRQYTESFHNKPSHAPGKFRVLGIMSNNEDFAKTFNCPRFSPMNPEKKCTLW